MCADSSTRHSKCLTIYTSTFSGENEFTPKKGNYLVKIDMPQNCHNF